MNRNTRTSIDIKLNHGVLATDDHTGEVLNRVIDREHMRGRRVIDDTINRLNLSGRIKYDATTPTGFRLALLGPEETREADLNKLMTSLAHITQKMVIEREKSPQPRRSITYVQESASYATGFGRGYGREQRA